MLFLANSLLTNGTTTFLNRLACERYIVTGNKIDILILNDQVDPNIEAKLKKVASIYHLNDLLKYKHHRLVKNSISNLLPTHEGTIRSLLERNNNSVHVMGCFGLLFIQNLINKLSLELSVTVGIYHQNEFMYREQDYYFQKKIKEILKVLPEENFIFFNEYNVISYSRYLKRNLDKSVITPIGINRGTTIKKTTINERLNICSIGNLNNFKTYNINMLYVVKKLVSHDVNVTYDIYGEGELNEKIQWLIKELSLQDHVKVHSNIEYNQLRTTISNYDVFVGSGTAVLEAASVGIPSIIGIESVSQDVTYGFLSDICGFSYNEWDPTRVTKTMFDCILSLTDVGFRYRIGRKCLEKSKEFTIDKTYCSFFSPALPYQRVPKLEFSALKVIGSMFKCAFDENILRQKSFSNRREQGDISNEV
ncbi:putative Glycosyltransferase [Vibrio crassostreae]|nr:putative Glycosyltransferase [Vibrio crassostreae]CAK2313980.1 putative Glycosyltransferase [Vibrio crassostreae]CAK2451066.1 putative Glycosyltransferase [Vibrio crassostreae]CAK2771265.1 putative Glycosyltransferase [Vibrio crassostreae]